VVDATSVAVNSSQIQKENKCHSEHRRKQIGYNSNREPQPLDSTNCQIVRWQWQQGMWEVERITTNDPIVVEKAEVFSNSVGL
jgi:hypothetical protein